MAAESETPAAGARDGSRDHDASAGPDAPATPVRIPITGELDLHTFQPRETAQVIDAYIEACLEKRICTVRIIHGKGTGTLRETVHAHLRRHPRMESFRLGDETSGGWGATLATLRPGK